MPQTSLLSRLRRALPVIIANAPAIIEAARQLREALRRRRRPQAPSDGSSA